MPRFAANLTMMYTEWSFLDRFKAAADDGFVAVEYLFPYAHPAEALARALQDNGLQQVLFNVSPGDFDAGERGMACHPGEEGRFMQALEQALAYARVLQCPRLHVMSGLLPQGVSRERAHHTLVERLRQACAQAREAGVTLLIEPINQRDMPGYFLSYQQQAHDLVAEVGAPNLQVQMDFYHCQIMEGDLLTRLRRHVAGVGHVQVAGVPDRHEPDAGEVAYGAVFRALDELGYTGWVGCEYRPAAGTSAGLSWLRAWR